MLHAAEDLSRLWEPRQEPPNSFCRRPGRQKDMYRGPQRDGAWHGAINTSTWGSTNFYLFGGLHLKPSEELPSNEVLQTCHMLLTATL